MNLPCVAYLDIAIAFTRDRSDASRWRPGEVLVDEFMFPLRSDLKIA